jgi:hypothetical protein
MQAARRLPQTPVSTWWHDGQLNATEDFRLLTDDRGTEVEAAVTAHTCKSLSRKPGRRMEEVSVHIRVGFVSDLSSLEMLKSGEKGMGGRNRVAC